ncbi:TPA: hydrogenase formation protein HypD [Candidatus Bathyarchaeota archaeon]|nr:hydrogenase formation protein HypD [Candidatus Bathyarchaeota archaeon]
MTIKSWSEFRNPKIARKIAEKIKQNTPRYQLKICHICGTHEWTITHYGLRSLLPDNIDLIAGPGCPVCVTPASYIDAAIAYALDGLSVLIYGDLLRVPGSSMSLQEARAKGGDVRVVYSIGDAVKIARKESSKEFVFFAVGFETTAPSTALELIEGFPRNLSLLLAHRLIPPAMEMLLGIGDLQIDGFIAPGHVSTIIGMRPYEIFPRAYGMPTVIAGFEPLDVLAAVLMLVKQIKSGEARLENEYYRSVKYEGNVRALNLIHTVFDIVEGRWRGLGRIPRSALSIKNDYFKFDALKKYDVKIERSMDLTPGCLCHLIMIGKIKPSECPLFMKVCTPQRPKGPCMVSSEGTCNIWAKHNPKLL